MGKKGFIYGDSMLSEIKNPYITKSSKSKDNILYPELSWENFNHKCHYNIAGKELGVKNKNSKRDKANFRLVIIKNSYEFIYLR